MFFRNAGNHIQECMASELRSASTSSPPEEISDLRIKCFRFIIIQLNSVLYSYRVDSTVTAANDRAAWE
jgi:hypothetical protein